MAEPPILRFTERDQDIVHCLSINVRLLSQRQVSDHWFEQETSNARRRMAGLIRSGLIEKVSIRARSLPPLESPLIQWQPGEPTPAFAQAAHQCRSRWRQRAVRSCVGYIATEKAAKLFGGRRRGGITKDLQVTHDLGVAQIWLQLDRTQPEWADAWRGEDIMATTRYRQKLPDAFIVDESGQPVCAMEFGGSYDAQRIEEFHQDSHQRNLPYQLW